MVSFLPFTSDYSTQSTVSHQKLAIVYYPKFPVLDRYAYYALHGTYEFDRYDAQVYVDYFMLVSRLAEQEHLTPKAMDEKLMEMGKKEQRYAEA